MNKFGVGDTVRFKENRLYMPFFKKNIELYTSSLFVIYVTEHYGGGISVVESKQGLHSDCHIKSDCINIFRVEEFYIAKALLIEIIK